MNNATRLFSLLVIFSSFSLFACGDDHDHDHDHEHGEDPAEEACEHLGNGPEVAVTASADAAGAPAVADDHKRYDITLPTGAAGSVTFEADEEGEFVFFFSKSLTFSIVDSAGNVVSPEATADNPGPCSDIAQSYTFDLSVGSYTLTLEGADGDTVSLVVEHASHEHEEA